MKMSIPVRAYRFLAPLGLAINNLIKPLGFQIVPTSKYVFTMEKAVSRAKKHGFQFKTIIDVGASDGRWSKMAAKYFGNANFLLFEPLIERKKELEHLKTKYENMDYVLAAVGEKEGEVDFHVAEDLDSSGIYEHESRNLRSVPVTTIDNQVKARNAEPPFLIKIDTHGFELPILTGASETLSQTNLVIIEAYNFKCTGNCLRFHELCGYIETLGFRCSDLADPMLRLKDDLLWQMDLFFIPKNSKFFDYPHYK